MDQMAKLLMSLLMAGNIWFVRKLVLKIDKIDETVTSRLPVQQNEIQNLTNKIGSLDSEIRSLSRELKDFGSLRERIAVIEALIKKKVKSEPRIR